MSAVHPHRPSFNPNPLALLAASFAAGILFARLASPPLFILLLSSALATLIALAAFERRRETLATLLLLLAFATAGAAFAGVEERGVSVERVRRLYEDGRVASGDPVEITGVIERAPEFAPDGFYLMLRVERLRARGAEGATAGAVELFAPVRDARVRGEEARDEHHHAEAEIDGADHHRVPKQQHREDGAKDDRLEPEILAQRFAHAEQGFVAEEEIGWTFLHVPAPWTLGCSPDARCRA